MKKMFTRKKMLAVVTGVTATAVMLTAGTFAWFTSQAEVVVEGGFTTAQVSLSAQAFDGYQVYEFFNGHQPNLNLQRHLESNFGNDEFSFEDFLREGNPNNWHVGMTQEGYNVHLDNLAYYDAALPGLVSELNEAVRQHNIASSHVQGTLAALGLAQSGVGVIYPGPMPEAPVRPVRADFPSGFAGTVPYLSAVGTWNLEMLAFNNVIMPAWNLANTVYWAAMNPLLDAVDWAEGQYLIFANARTAAQNALNEAQGALDRVMEFLNNAIIVNYADPETVTPGSIIFGEFEFTNASNVYTFFRVNGGILESLVDVEGNSIMHAASARFVGGDEVINLVLCEEDGYLYSPIPLGAGSDIELTVGVYLFGAANNSDGHLHNLNFSLSGLGVELIQAGNNAAVLSGWAPSLGDSFFQNN